MGGFLVDGPGTERPFPVNAKQLRFLIEKGYVKYPMIDEDDINDRNKSDAFSRYVPHLLKTVAHRLIRMSSVIAVCQALWLLVNCAMRVAQGLALTTLELTTISFVVVFLVTSFCWRFKPSDISSTLTLHSNTNFDIMRKQVRLTLSQLIFSAIDSIPFRSSTAHIPRKNGTRLPLTSCATMYLSVQCTGATTRKSCAKCIFLCFHAP